MDNEVEYNNLSDALSIVICIVVVLIGITVTLGNAIVIVAMIAEKSLRTPPNLYLGSLALIDLSVGVFIIPLRIVQTFNNNNWIFGGTLCEMYLILDVTLCTLSIYHLILIALDRYKAIANGLQYVQRRSFTTVGITIAIAIIMALWISIPPALGWHDEEDWGLVVDKVKGARICEMTRNKGYVFHSSLGSFILPIGTVLFLYIRIYFEIKKRLHKKIKHDSRNFVPANGDSEQKLNVNTQPETGESKNKTLKRIQFQLVKLSQSVHHHNSEEDFESENSENSGSGSSRSLSTTKPASSQMQDFDKKKKKFSLNKEKQAVKTLGVIILAFLFCWIPFCTVYLINSFWMPLNDSVLFEIFTWLSYFNSAMNPFIYTTFNTEFRTACTKIILFCKLK